jgi:hypothetical protein
MISKAKVHNSTLSGYTGGAATPKTINVARSPVMTPRSKQNSAILCHNCRELAMMHVRIEVSTEHPRAMPNCNKLFLHDRREDFGCPPVPVDRSDPKISTDTS